MALEIQCFSMHAKCHTIVIDSLIIPCHSLPKELNGTFFEHQKKGRCKTFNYKYGWPVLNKYLITYHNMDGS